MARFQDAMVQEVISWNGDQSHWNLSLLRSPNDWEKDSACNLLPQLADMKAAPQSTDEIVWPRDPKGSFIVKSFCNTLHDQSSCSNFPESAIRRSKAPPKACFLLGQPPNKKFPQKIYLKEEIFMGQVGVRCALRRSNQSIASLCNVIGSHRFGIWFFP